MTNTSERDSIVILSRAYNANQYPQRTLDLFEEMRDKAKIKPNNISYMLYFQACVMLKSFETRQNNASRIKREKHFIHEE